MAKRTIVGSYYWTTGPLVVGTAASQKLVQKDRDRTALKTLARTKKAAETAKLGKQSVVVFPGQFPSTWVLLGKDAGVLVRMAGHSIKSKDALSIDPWSVTDWKLDVATVKLDGKAILYDAISKHPEGKVSGSDAKSIALALPAGTYVVDRATAGDRDFKVVLHRFRPSKWTPQPPKSPPGKQPGPPGDIVLRDETKALAKKLEFVASEEGGSPVIACPKSLLASWGGIDAGDYDRACDTRGFVLKVGKGQSLVFETDSIAFAQMKDGTAYAFIWVGADDKSHVVEAVLSSPESAWKKTKETFSMKGNELVFLDAALDGKSKGRAVKLAPGKYAIDAMKEYDGVIHVGKRKHDVMAQGLRLRPV